MATAPGFVFNLVSATALLYLPHFSFCTQKDFDFSPDYHIHQITEPVDHAEGPHWMEDEHALYYVDISGFGVHRFDPYTSKHTSITLKSTVGVIIPIEGAKGKFLIGHGKNISILSWDGESKEYGLEDKYTVDAEKIGNRFNDGKADVRGRVWIGTMGEEKPIGVIKPNQGSLFRVAKNCDLKKILTPVSISNGIAWSADNTKMFYIDSPTRKIDVFDYNVCNGEISNRKIFFNFQEHNLTGVPDGMTIDSDDNLWIANWGGGRVLEVSRDGQLVGVVHMPVERVTSVAWGGIGYDTLFVTTMRLGLSQEELRKQPLAGAVFKVTNLRRKGRPANSAAPCILDRPSFH